VKSGKLGDENITTSARRESFESRKRGEHEGQEVAGMVGTLDKEIGGMKASLTGSGTRSWIWFAESSRLEKGYLIEIHLQI